ncbi:ankyrin repeat domain 9 [Strigomonas culicis]|uniref:Ankyrin repeat domain 9 n=1 Tax=Strigomonas culicis TaxID=28005 RepID=S9UMF6_9TRYP|nr:ankyrin repeat domain 9 [Strigomonas culicis]|eukprot:EPY15896.1 ankyrin repeat domain 9 [Strigomonas culicis]
MCSLCCRPAWTSSASRSIWASRARPRRWPHRIPRTRRKIPSSPPATRGPTRTRRRPPTWCACRSGWSGAGRTLCCCTSAAPPVRRTRTCRGAPRPCSRSLCAWRTAPTSASSGSTGAWRATATCCRSPRWTACGC